MANQTPAPQTQVTVTEAADYRDIYANSVQVKASVWDIQLVFGQAANTAPDQITIRSQQGVFLSPQQAKALFNVLGQNLAQYEQTFGEIRLEPQQAQPAQSTGFPPPPNAVN